MEVESMNGLPIDRKELGMSLSENVEDKLGEIRAFYAAKRKDMPLTNEKELEEWLAVNRLMFFILP
jgi:hypothetical protein